MPRPVLLLLDFPGDGVAPAGSGIPDHVDMAVPATAQLLRADAGRPAPAPDLVGWHAPMVLCETVKTLLRANAEIDLLSPEENAKALQDAFASYEEWSRGQEGETIIRASSFTLDTNGATVIGFPDGGKPIYVVPAGYDAFLTRATFDFEGSNATSGVSCDIRLVADQNTPTALRAIYNTIPSVVEMSKSHAPMFRGGQRVVVSITGATANLNVGVSVQVILTPRKALDLDTLDSEGT